jgi:cytoskeletal protein CcmA (bactofilin family)
MFGKKDKTMGGFASGSTTLLSKSTEVIGDMHFTGNLEVEGIVRGNVIANGDARVRVMEKGLVEGEISAPNVVINGRVVGDVYSSKHVELAANAVVEGNVHYQLIEMVKGAQVNGSLVYSADKGSEDKPESLKVDKKKNKANKNQSDDLLADAVVS